MVMQCKRSRKSACLAIDNKFSLRAGTYSISFKSKGEAGVGRIQFPTPLILREFPLPM